jgi:hypothetical protein
VIGASTLEFTSLLGKRSTFTEIIPSFPAAFKKQEIDKFTFASWPTRSDFREIRFSDIPYIDKTSFFQRLFDKGHIFLSRPRRFGKTLLVNSLKELFLGNRELFTGLEVEVNWDWAQRKYPVIKLDFSRIASEDFSERLCSLLISEGTQYGLNFDNIRRSFADIFEHLAESLKKMNGKDGRKETFVILIDEYDQPVVDALCSPSLMSQNLSILNNFLKLVKSTSPVFSLVTGSFRLARTAIFSGDNIREDISFDQDFNSICGFTESEIRHYLKLGKLTIQDLKTWYNGYSFGGDEGIFNPFSVAKAIVRQHIDCYWVNSGSTRILADFCGTDSMRDFITNRLLATDYSTNMISLVQSEDPLTFGKSPESLQRLFVQSGYLTISADSSNASLCNFRVPNKEIRDYAIPGLLISGLVKMPVSQCHAHFFTFSEAVQSRNLENMYDSIMDLFQVIGYPDRGKIDKCEDYYQRILQVFLLAICPSVRIEERTSLGKSDIFADFGSWKILFELKAFEGKKSILEGDSKLESLIGDAFLQMKEKYANGLLADIFCVLVFNTSTRTLFPRNTFKVPFYAQRSDLRSFQGKLG